MIIESSKYPREVQGNQRVNQIGKYLYKHIDSAYDYKKTSNMYDVFFTVMYQVPGDASTFSEMNIDLNITTYSDKIRVNTIEVSPEERTLGFDLFKLDLFDEMPKAKDIVLAKIQKRIAKAYEDYDFLF